MELRQPLVKQLTSCAGTGLLTLPDKSACGNSLGVCADEYLLFPTPTATASCIYLEKGVNFFSPPGTIGPGEKPHSQSRLLSSFHDPLPPLPGTGSWRLHCLLLIPSGLKLREPWPQRRRAPGGERAGGSARGSGDVGGGSGKENIELGVKTSEANREGKKGRVLTAQRRPGGDGAVCPRRELCEFVQGGPSRRWEATEPRHAGGLVGPRVRAHPGCGTLYLSQPGCYSEASHRTDHELRPSPLMPRAPGGAGASRPLGGCSDPRGP